MLVCICNLLVNLKFSKLNARYDKTTRRDDTYITIFKVSLKSNEKVVNPKL